MLPSAAICYVCERVYVYVCISISILSLVFSHLHIQSYAHIICISLFAHQNLYTPLCCCTSTVVTITTTTTTAAKTLHRFAKQKFCCTYCIYIHTYKFKSKYVSRYAKHAKACVNMHMYAYICINILTCAFCTPLHVHMF